MDKAICWELSCDTAGITGFRLFVADRFMGVQTLSVSNERPLWDVQSFDDKNIAAERALAITESYSEATAYGAKLAVEPGEIILHDAERRAMSHGGPIPPSFRARIYTSLHRRRQKSVEA